MAVESISASAKRIAVLIPCYNEAATIAKVVCEYHEALPEAIIYVYDNNSSDTTAELACQAGAVVRQELRQGKGNVVRSMFREIDADCYLMIDGDDTYPAASARTMCDLVLKGKADMVIGDRLSTTYFEQNKRPLHNWGNELVCRTINHLWRPKKPITDVMTGYRAFSPLFVKTFPVLSQGFEIETEMTVHALDKNFLLQTVPIAYRDRPEGSVSKLNTWRDGKKILWTIFQMFRDYKPMRFFGNVSLALTIVAMILLVPIFLTFYKTGLVPRIPTFIGSMFLLIGALLSCVCGLILDTNATKQRKNFEVQVNIIRMLLK